MSIGPMQDLTMEDLATFKRCRKESFWRRCVPFAISGCIMVGLVQSSGYFNSRARLKFPAYLCTVVGGYFLGKFSYVDKCRQMFYQLDNSRIKDYLLNKNNFRPPNYGPQDSGANDPIYVETPVEGARKPGPPLTYSQRRELYRQKEQSSQNEFNHPHKQYSEQEQSQTLSVTNSKTHKYFDQDQPLSSLLSEDTFSSRD